MTDTRPSVRRRTAALVTAVAAGALTLTGCESGGVDPARRTRVQR